MNGGKILVPHWDAASALEAYRGERDGVRRAHLQVIWLLLSGEAGSAVARVTGFSVRWIEKLVARWNAEGPAGLGDRRRGNGAAPVLDEAGLVALAAALDAGPADGGCGAAARWRPGCRAYTPFGAAQSLCCWGKHRQCGSRSLRQRGLPHDSVGYRE
jgi:hypothetical protein